MTLLNHIGVFILILLSLYLIVAFSEKRFRTFTIIQKLWLTPIASLFFYGVFEAFYWTVKIFFL